MFTDYKWVIAALEKNGQIYTVPEQLVGLKRVFVKGGLTYSFLPSQKEEDAIPYEYTVDAGRITFYKPEKTEAYAYQLEYYGIYFLYLDMVGNDNGYTVVFERAEKNEVKSVEQMVLIGEQIWSDRNLNVDTFKNGDPIYESKSKAQWEAFGKKGQPTWCYANFDPENHNVYGKLYNFYAVIDPRGLAPKGWHIPTIEEIHELIDYAGGVEVANDKLKSRYYWSEKHKGTNSSGFNGMPGGHILPDGDFSYFGMHCDIWTGSQDTYEGKPKGLYMSLDVSKNKMYKTYISDYAYGRSVRLIKDY